MTKYTELRRRWLVLADAYTVHGQAADALRCEQNAAIFDELLAALKKETVKHGN